MQKNPSKPPQNDEPILLVTIKTIWGIGKVKLRRNDPTQRQKRIGTKKTLRRKSLTKTTLRKSNWKLGRTRAAATGNPLTGCLKKTGKIRKIVEAVFTIPVTASAAVKLTAYPTAMTIDLTTRRTTMSRTTIHRVRVVGRLLGILEATPLDDRLVPNDPDLPEARETTADPPAVTARNRATQKVEHRVPIEATPFIRKSQA